MIDTKRINRNIRAAKRRHLWRAWRETFWVCIAILGAFGAAMGVYFLVS